MKITRREIINLLTARLDERRLRHSLAAEKEATSLAVHHGEDWRKAALAALLHDLCRCDPTEWQRSYLRARSVKLAREWLCDPQLLHGPCVAEYIRCELGVTDREILSAVRYHTTGRPGMTNLEKIVFLADKIEATRDYDGVEKTRAAAYQSLDKAVHFVLGHNLAQVCKMGLPLVKEAVGAYNELTTRIIDEEG
ncbi:MAG: bis(5'-nucleosyl)-tetraphosphatase (symmetrical) YqeK [Oscillospiraceae bacterium]|nr:bis(5'-nucleosyl)-tetraphosphatase (symmetrical) YqeK [Oscillospiraceae bacterium]